MSGEQKSAAGAARVDGLDTAASVTAPSPDPRADATASPSSFPPPSREQGISTPPLRASDDESAPADPTASEGDSESAPADPTVAAAPSSALEGELGATPHGPVVTALLAVTGVLLVRSIAALVGRHALAVRRPATVHLTPKGLELTHRVELLGRTLREGKAVYPIDNLVSVAREVRFARAGTYAGLAALALGTYLGVTLLADGVRAPGGSPTLIALGLAIVALGLAVDFVLTTAFDSARRRVRLIIAPRRGRSIAIGNLSEEQTDAALRHVAALDREPATK